MTTAQTTVTLTRVLGGGEKEVGYGHPCQDALDGIRVRISKVENDGMIEVMDDDGKVLPDLRHPTQLRAW
jgi:hypothetical protein